MVVATSLLVLGFAAPAVAGDNVPGVHLTATVNGTRLADRVRLDPARSADVDITFKNGTSSVVRVRSVRLTGSVLGLTFFDVGTSTGLEIPAGQTRNWRVEVDISDLDGQATGLLPLEVSVVGQDRKTLASVNGTADVRGSVTSTYGLFGVGILIATGLLWASALLALARRRLPPNRWKRAVQFAVGGVGFGLAAVVTLSVLRVTAPSATAEIGFVAVATAVAFGLGFLTPPSNLPAPDVFWTAAEGTTPAVPTPPVPKPAEPTPTEPDPAKPTPAEPTPAEPAQAEPAQSAGSGR
jgi:hypothetical protein